MCPVPVNAQGFGKSPANVSSCGERVWPRGARQSAALTPRRFLAVKDFQKRKTQIFVPWNNMYLFFISQNDFCGLGFLFIGRVTGKDR